MRRLVPFLLLAAMAAGPLAAQVPDPQGQRAPRGDRGDQGWRRGPDATANAPGTQPGGPRFDRATPAQPVPGVNADPRGGRGRYGDRSADQRDGRFDGRGGNGPNGGLAGRPDRPDSRFDRRPGDAQNGRLAGGRGDWRGDRPDLRPGDRPGDRFDGRPGVGRNDGFDPRRGSSVYGGYAGRPGDRYGNGPGYQGRAGWNGQWRNDRRYDWQGYRATNRNLFRAPRYYGPRGYDYSRWSRGYRVQPFFYGQSYWISDPWRYRLPPADGSYR